MEATPSTTNPSDGRTPSRTLPSSYVRSLSLAEIGCGRQEGGRHRPCLFEVFVRAGLPLAEGVIVGQEAHREFIGQSALKEDLLLSPRDGEDAASRAMGIRLLHLSSPIEGELNRQICEALIGLGVPSVTVVSEGLAQRRLKTIPEVKDAIREAWLSSEGLGRQMEAASRGEEMPTWPVFILVDEETH